MILTRPQREAVYKLYQRSHANSTSYYNFRRRVIPSPTYSIDPYILIPWCGMWIGIEPNGYTHS